MKKIYIIKTNIHNGDSFDDGPFFTVEKAQTEAGYMWDRLTEKEKSSREMYIAAYEVADDINTLREFYDYQEEQNIGNGWPEAVEIIDIEK